MPRATVWIGIATMFVGALVSLTVIGAIVGVPLILFGLCLSLFGAALGWITGGVSNSSQPYPQSKQSSNSSDGNSNSHPGPGVSDS